MGPKLKEESNTTIVHLQISFYLMFTVLSFQLCFENALNGRIDGDYFVSDLSLYSSIDEAEFTSR